MPILVVACGLRREVAACAAHNLVDDEHARVRAVLRNNVLREEGGLLRGGASTERLADRNDVVVDRLRQTHDLERVVVVGEVLREVGGSRVRVIATDRVEHVNAVSLELVRSDLESVLALLDEAALDEVLRVCELHARVANGRSAVVVQEVRVLAGLIVDDDLFAGEQTPVAVLVGDDLDLGVQLVIALDQAADGGREARGVTARGQESNALDAHEGPSQVVWCAAKTPHVCATILQFSPSRLPRQKPSCNRRTG